MKHIPLPLAQLILHNSKPTVLKNLFCFVPPKKLHKKCDIMTTVLYLTIKHEMQNRQAGEVDEHKDNLVNQQSST
jgi:hypothetical protein